MTRASLSSAWEPAAAAESSPTHSSIHLKISACQRRELPALRTQ